MAYSRKLNQTKSTNNSASPKKNFLSYIFVACALIVVFIFGILVGRVNPNMLISQWLNDLKSFVSTAITCLSGEDSNHKPSNGYYSSSKYTPLSSTRRTNPKNAETNIIKAPGSDRNHSTSINISSKKGGSISAPLKQKKSAAKPSNKHKSGSSKNTHTHTSSFVNTVAINRDAVHSSSQFDIFESNGRWEDPDFAITKFAGLEFGSDMYCKTGELGVTMGSSPSGENGKYEPSYVGRHAEITLEGGFLGYDTVETSYSYETKQLKNLTFRKLFDLTDEGYESAVQTFINGVDTLCEQFGMPEPEYIITKGAVGNNDELYYHRESGTTHIISQVRNGAKNQIEVYLGIRDTSYSKIASEESESAIANPPTRQLQNWVERHETHPTYWSRKQ